MSPRKRIPACAVYWLTFAREPVQLPGGAEMFRVGRVWYGRYSAMVDGAEVRVTRSLETSDAAAAAFRLGVLVKEAK